MKKYLITLLLIFSNLSSYEYEVGVVSVFHNEAKFLPEWIEYHQEQGVDHFWLYNYKSKDDYETVLQPYITNGLVELIEWSPNKESIEWDKSAAYQDSIKKSKGVTRWLAIIDADEFIIPCRYKNLTVLLDDNEEYARIPISCLNFGGYIQITNDKMPLIYSLRIREKQNNSRSGLYKSVIQLEKI